MTEKFLRDQLVGAWELTSFIERDIKTGVENHPFGKHPLGLILYTPDGYVSAQLQRPERPPFADEDPLHATPDEYAAAGRSYVAYSGRFFCAHSSTGSGQRSSTSAFIAIAEKAADILQGNRPAEAPHLA
jgi:hypothetical protein